MILLENVVTTCLQSTPGRGRGGQLFEEQLGLSLILSEGSVRLILSCYCGRKDCIRRTFSSSIDAASGRPSITRAIIVNRTIMIGLVWPKATAKQGVHK